MADKTIPELTAAGALSGAESFHIVQGGESREVTLDELAAYIKTAETIVPANLPYRGARVYRNTDATSVTFPAIVSYQAVDFDTDAFWDAGSPTRFTIPAGISKIRLKGQVVLTFAAAAGGYYATMRKNSTGTVAMNPTLPGISAGVMRQGNSGYGNNILLIETGVLNVVAGDWFDFRINTTASGINSILGTTGETWFELEVVETD